MHYKKRRWKTRKKKNTREIKISIINTKNYTNKKKERNKE